MRELSRSLLNISFSDSLLYRRDAVIVALGGGVVGDISGYKDPNPKYDWFRTMPRVEDVEHTRIWVIGLEELPESPPLFDDVDGKL